MAAFITAHVPYGQLNAAISNLFLSGFLLANDATTLEAHNQAWDQCLAAAIDLLAVSEPTYAACLQTIDREPPAFAASDNKGTE